MKVILKQDVKSIGKKDEIHEVSDGYARNYLLPRGFAVAVNKGTLRQAEARKLKLQKEREERLAVAKALAEKIEALEIVLPMAVGENDKLFGSVSAQVVADAINAQGIEIGKADVLLDEGIRELGDYTIVIKVSGDVKANLKLKVTKKED